MRGVWQACCDLRDASSLLSLLLSANYHTGCPKAPAPPPRGLCLLLFASRDFLRWQGEKMIQMGFWMFFPDANETVAAAASWHLLRWRQACPRHHNPCLWYHRIRR